MSNGFLSQEEIDSLLNGGSFEPEPVEEEILSELEKDLLGEIGNISMGSASTSLSTLINQQVNITTPVVTLSSLRALKENFVVPNIALDVKYTSGIVGENLLVMKTTDAAVIANLMMGGDGRITGVPELSEIEVSAVSEAMNQMIGSAATSMATMFGREINISPPDSKIWDEATANLSSNISEDEDVIEVSFKLTIGDLVDSSIMQILPLETAKKIVSIMMGQEESEPEPIQGKPVEAPVSYQSAPQPVSQPAPKPAPQSVQQPPYQQSSSYYQPEPQYYPEPQPQYQYAQEAKPEPQVDVHQASFQPLSAGGPSYAGTKNLDLILDVPLEITVVLGRTKKNIKDVLNLGTGSLIELDKLAEEPVEILVNGKKVAYGEVVVVDENFGVRITNIVSGAERIKSLSGK